MFAINKTKSAAILLLFSFLLTVLSLPLVSANGEFWTALEPMPTSRSNLGVATVDGKIYAIAGIINSKFTNVTEMYDTKTGTWVNKAAMTAPRADFGIAVYQNKIYVFGGFGYFPDGRPGYVEATEVYDPVTDTWETKASIPTPRSVCCANVVNNKIYIIGGNDIQYPSWPRLRNENEVYDPETDTWETKAPLPGFLGYTAADLTSAVVDDKIYLISATEYNSTDPTKYNSTVPFNSVYDPETDTWSSAQMMPTMVRGLVAGTTSGEFAPKRIHVLTSNTHQIYDPQTNTWTNGTSIPTVRYGFGVDVINDTLYAIGGNSANEKYTPANYIPEFSSWIVLLLLLVTTLVAVVCNPKLTKNKSSILCEHNG